MAIDDRKRQKKLMKKRQKDKERKKAQAQEKAQAAVTPKQRLMAARNYPIHQCLMNPNWPEMGLAHILMARKQPNGNITFGVFLVDTYYLGVKDCFHHVDFPPLQYKTEVEDGMRSRGGEECPPHLAHSVIYGGIDFAAKQGVKPHKDYRLAQYVLDPREEVEPLEALEFGRDGKPFYIQGPHDDPERILGRGAGMENDEDLEDDEFDEGEEFEEEDEFEDESEPIR